ncbi:MAG: lipopolysaccharide biosynthesis protein [Actinobacteria bacterium]|nr:lipopolysaccharide biosynthesis protein [Actinomycetota bacterium]
MESGLFRRRATTAAGLWGSAALGVLATVAAVRILDDEEAFGAFAVVVATASFFQTLLDLTVEEALTKYGFRYLAAGDPGRLRRLFRKALVLKLAGGVLALVALLALAPFADTLLNGDGLGWYLVIVAALPLVQSPENVGSTALILHGRYDLRALFLALAMALRLAGIGIGAAFGVGWALAGVVVAQVVSTAAIATAGLVAYRRLPTGEERALGEDVPEIRRFVLTSSLSTGTVALRSSLVPVILSAVTTPRQAGFLRIAQAPQAGFTALTGPIRLILLTEQTKAWEEGRRREVVRGVYRYMAGAVAFCLVAVPVFYALMPWLVRTVFGTDYVDATHAARIVLFAAAIHLVLGWTKSFAVTVGRPGFRLVAHGVETAVLVPLTAILGARSGVDGAAWAFLVSAGAFAVVWALLLLRIRWEVAGADARSTGGGALQP